MLTTINDLADLYPSVQSIGIVPVGLTGHRQGLPVIGSFTSAQARELIEQANRWQDKFRSQWGTGLVYLADEFL